MLPRWRRRSWKRLFLECGDGCRFLYNREAIVRSPRRPAELSAAPQSRRWFMGFDGFWMKVLYLSLLFAFLGVGR